MINMNKKIVISKYDIPYIIAVFLLFSETYISTLYYVFFNSDSTKIFLTIFSFILLLFLSGKSIWKNNINRSEFLVLLLVLSIIIIVLLGSMPLVESIRYITLYLSVFLAGRNRRWQQYFFGLMYLFSIVFIISTIWLRFDIDSYRKIYQQLYPYKMDRAENSIRQGITTGLTDHYSHNGIMIGNSLVLYSSFFICDKQNKKALTIGLLILNIIAMILCGKRAMVIFPLVAIVSGYLIFNHKEMKKNFLKYMVFFLVIVVVVYLFSQYNMDFAHYLERFSNMNEDTNIIERYRYWAIAISLFLNNRLTGIGWYNFTQYNEGIEAHNIYIQILCETGIVGAIVFSLFFVVVFAISIRNLVTISKNKYIYSNQLKMSTFFCFTYQFYFLLYGMTGNPLTLMYSLMPFVASVSISLLNYREIKRGELSG